MQLKHPKYPKYYAIEHEETGDIVLFLKVEKDDDVAFPDRLMDWVNSLFVIKPITSNEVESYVFMGVADTVSPTGFTKWITENIDSGFLPP